MVLLTQIMALLILFWSIQHLNVHNLFSYKVKIICVMKMVTIKQSQTYANFSSLEFLDFSQVFCTWLQQPHALIDSRWNPQFALGNLDLWPNNFVLHPSN